MTSFSKPIRRSLRTLAASIGAVVLLGAGACAISTDRTEQVQEASAPAEGERADQTAEGHHWRGRHRSPVRVVLEVAVQHGDLSAEQEHRVGEIRADLDADHEARHKIRKQLRSSALDIVRSGTANSKQFDQTVDQAMSAVAERMQASSDALKELHAILEPAQRVAVADGVRERLAERRAKHHRKHRKRVKRMASYLMLTPDQIEKLDRMRKELMGTHERVRPSHEEIDALVDAFEGEEFDEALDELQTSKAAILRERVSQAGEYADTALSVLSTDQRGMVADLIERGPREVMVDKER